VKRALAALLLAASTAAGCAYYNGLFNANRLAGEARKAEREGRTAEARSLWSRAAVKAESVATRFKKSRYRDDALILQGLALARLGSCTAAVPPLRTAADSSHDNGLRTQAALLLGQCWLTLEAPDSALSALATVTDDAPPATRREVLLLRGEARLRVGDPEGALADLESAGAGSATFPRAVALTAVGRPDDAAALLATVVDSPYVEAGWLAALDSLGLHVPDAASDLVDRLVADERPGPGGRARLLLGDGERWQRAGALERATGRFTMVAAEVPDSSEGHIARAHLAILAVRRAGSVAAVGPLLDSIQAASRSGGRALVTSGRFLSVLGRAGEAVSDSGTALELFLSAEDVRDSLAAPGLAAALFAEVERRFAESVIAPKALIALAGLRPEQTDSLIGHLETHYPESVYTLALRGAAGDRYQAVEDSLLRATWDLRRGTPRERRPQTIR
jgi:predicted negative regulator of RcsB-dependent stress response